MEIGDNKFLIEGDKFLNGIIIDYGIDEAALKRVSEFLLLTVKDGSDKENYKKIREARKELRDIKSHVKTKHKEFKAHAKDFLSKSDLVADKILTRIQESDSHLIAQENIVKDELQRLKNLRAEEERKKLELVDERISQLAEYGLNVRMQFERDFVQNQTDEQFKDLLERTKKEYEESIAVVNKISEVTDTVVEAVNNISESMHKAGEAIAGSNISGWQVNEVVQDDILNETVEIENPAFENVEPFSKPVNSEGKEIEKKGLVKSFGFFKTPTVTLKSDVGDFYFIVKKENAELVSKLLTQNLNG